MEWFKEIVPEEIGANIIDMIGRQWMLITAGDANHCNTMTASWGGMGVLWGKPVATIYIRPQRYTKEFIDGQERLTLSFLAEQHRKALTYLGSHSGRDYDKITDSGLGTELTPDGVPFIAEAETVIQCRKMYVDKISPEHFVDAYVAEKWYPERDFHYFYICEIEKILVRGK